ncbi:MAG: 2'-5' RNA ligase family protein [Anaerolineales bacterium]|jgi:2'-5' RNA ligase
MYKTIDKCLSVTFQVENPNIEEAKKYLEKNFDSIYSINPHITFSITPIPARNLENAKKAIEDFFSDRKGFIVRLQGIAANPKSRFLYLKVQSGGISKLHADLVALLNKYRDGYIREKDVGRIEQGYYNPSQIQNIVDYGFPRVMDLYQPHITLGNIPDGQVDIEQVKSKLVEILANSAEGNIHISNVMVHYFSDAINQSQLEVIWDKKYPLQS